MHKRYVWDLTEFDKNAYLPRPAATNPDQGLPDGLWRFLHQAFAVPLASLTMKCGMTIEREDKRGNQ
jgi:hypothetical protein